MNATPTPGTNAPSDAVIDALLAQLTTARDTIGDSPELSGLRDELEALRHQPGEQAAARLSALRERIDHTLSTATGQHAQARQIAGADARAIDYLAGSRAQADSLWEDASERHGHLLSEEERRTINAARLREEEALEAGDALAAIEARREWLHATKDLYDRAGDTHGARRADALLRETNQHYASMLEARGLNAQEVQAALAAPITQVAEHERKEAQDAADLSAFIDPAELPAADTIALTECDGETITCTPTPHDQGTPKRGRE